MAFYRMTFIQKTYNQFISNRMTYKANTHLQTGHLRGIISNGREPKSCLGLVFKSYMGRVGLPHGMVGACQAAIIYVSLNVMRSERFCSFMTPDEMTFR
jgi:hypothetical protein